MSEVRKIRLGALGSGRGSNILAILSNIRDGSLNAELAVVLTDRESSRLLVTMAEQDIPIHYVDPKNYPDRNTYDQELVRILREQSVDMVILAGFMRLLTREFIDAFPLKIMNIHSSLLPAFSGLDAQKKALDYGVKFSGCTVHFVDEGMDTGPVIIQAVVPVEDTDTPESLSERILNEEHRIYSRAIELFAQDKLRIEGRRVYTNGI